MAPPIAASVLESAQFHVADLIGEVTGSTRDLPHGTIVLVESVGGVRSPIAIDGDTVTLVSELKPELVVLVADADLGTINLVRLSHDVLLAHRTVVYLNRYDPEDEMHNRNRDWLVTHLGLEVVSDAVALEEIVAALIR
jgi:dethiobiotin synthetase